MPTVALTCNQRKYHRQHSSALITYADCISWCLTLSAGGSSALASCCGLGAGEALGVSSSQAISSSAAACARCASFCRCACFCCSLCSLQGRSNPEAELWWPYPSVIGISLSSMLLFRRG